MTTVSASSARPALSVVVPTYQRPEPLARALQSARAAFSGALELLVVDDCPDGSGFAIARAHGARYVHKAGCDRGLSASRNIGLALARGSCLSFLDDDDCFAPGALDALVTAARSSGGLAYGDHGLFAGEARREIELSSVTIDDLMVCNRIPVGSYVIDRSAVCVRFDERLRSHEDWDFLLSHAARVGFQHVPGVAVWIDKTDNATTSMQARRRATFWLDFLSIYARFPAPALARARSEMLGKLGLSVDAGLLAFEDRI